MSSCTALTYSTKFGMLILSAILFGHSVQIIRLRQSTQHVTELLNSMADNYAGNYPREHIIRDAQHVISSRWLGMHVVPVGLWVILAFLQTWTWFRKRYLRVHRFLGVTYLLLSVWMMIGVALMFLTGEELYGEREFHLDVREPRKIFTFSAASVVFGVWWVYGMWRVYQTATWNTIHLHKYWVLQFLATGFGPGTMRLLTAAYMMKYYPPLGDVVLSEEVNNAIFGYSLWLGFALNLVLVHVFIATGVVNVTSSRRESKML